MKLFGWIQVVLGLLAIGPGAIVLRGILRVALSGNRVVWFLKCSLIAALASLLPISHPIPLVQEINILLVYCVAVTVLAWHKFRLAGLWRPVFAFLLVAVLYLNVVSVSFLLFKYSSLLAMASTESVACFAIAQFCFASVFVVLEVLVVRMCHTQRTY